MKKSEEWLPALKAFEGGRRKNSLIQLILTLSLYLLLLSLLFILAKQDAPYWLILLLAIPAAGFHVKTFIISKIALKSALINAFMT